MNYIGSTFKVVPLILKRGLDSYKFLIKRIVADLRARKLL